MTKYIVEVLLWVNESPSEHVELGVVNEVVEAQSDEEAADLVVRHYDERDKHQPEYCDGLLVNRTMRTIAIADASKPLTIPPEDWAEREYEEHNPNYLDEGEQ